MAAKKTKPSNKITLDEIYEIEKRNPKSFSDVSVEFIYAVLNCMMEHESFFRKIIYYTKEIVMLNVGLSRDFMNVFLAARDFYYTNGTIPTYKDLKTKSTLFYKNPIDIEIFEKIVDNVRNFKNYGYEDERTERIEKIGFEIIEKKWISWVLFNLTNSIQYGDYTHSLNVLKVLMFEFETMNEDEKTNSIIKKFLEFVSIQQGYTTKNNNRCAWISDDEIIKQLDGRITKQDLSFFKETIKKNGMKFYDIGCYETKKKSNNKVPVYEFLYRNNTELDIAFNHCVYAVPFDLLLLNQEANKKLRENDEDKIKEGVIVDAPPFSMEMLGVHKKFEL